MADEDKGAAARTIKIDENGRNSGRVLLSINGQGRWLEVGKPIAVSDEEVEALNNSDIEFTEVADGGAVVSASSAAPAAPPEIGEAANTGLTETVPLIGSGDPGDDGDTPHSTVSPPHNPIDPAQAGSNPDGAAGVEAGTDGEGGSEGGDGTGPQAAESTPDPDEEMLGQSVTALKAELADVQDADRLQRLLDKENGAGPDKARKGAVKAIEDRIAALKQSEA